MARPPLPPRPPPEDSRISLHGSCGYTGFFECKSCFTHLALNQNISHSHTPLGLGSSFPKIVNVDIVARSYEMNSIQVEADLYCIRCYKHVGWKLVANQRFTGIFVLKWDLIKLHFPTSKSPLARG